MKHIFLVILLITACVTQASAADGRRTNAILGFAAGAVTGWMVHDAMPTKPVVNREIYVAPGEHRWSTERNDYHHYHHYHHYRHYRHVQKREVVIERVVIVEPPAKRYVRLKGAKTDSMGTSVIVYWPSVSGPLNDG